MLKCNTTLHFTRDMCLCVYVQVCACVCSIEWFPWTENTPLVTQTICYSETESYFLPYDDSAFGTCRKRSLISSRSTNKSVPLIPIIYITVVFQDLYILISIAVGILIV